MRRTVELISGSVVTLIVERDSTTFLASDRDGIERLYRFTPSEWSQLIAPETRQVALTVA